LRLDHANGLWRQLLCSDNILELQERLEALLYALVERVACKFRLRLGDENADVFLESGDVVGRLTLLSQRSDN